MKNGITKWLNRYRFALALIAILIAGGGCMTPYFPSQKVDLAALGADEHTLARLAGESDLKPTEPQPVCNLYGDLLVVPLEYRYDRGNLGNHHQHVQSIVEPLKDLHGIERVVYASRLPQSWDPSLAQHRERPETIDLRALIMEQADDLGCDMVLIYTAKTNAEVTDITLTLGSMLTLGTAPTKVITADAELEVVLMDAQTGYIYAITEVEGGAWQMANFFGHIEAQYRQDYAAQRDAIKLLVTRLQAAWPEMRAAYP